MPERKPRKIDSAEVQGKDSYVIVTDMTVGDVKAIRVDNMDETIDLYTANAARIIARVLEWNWVDYDGDPLPPPDTPDVVNLLTAPELDFLSDAVGGRVEEEAQKN